MEEIYIVRNVKFNNLYDVHHVKWIEGEPKLIKTIDTEVTFNYAIDLRAHHMNLLDIPEVEEV